ncbi:hypothetical protein K7X08_020323 [Anisodus acutangulus]|uniref:PX domain-containing protein n=1 Tax=Anisodus acutangulus TaxID=402998 RepID=A0A9Q1M677_9SOLA|nr:hypothetical protein K7X08_020323 [Anisodus acutangulus]
MKPNPMETCMQRHLYTYTEEILSSSSLPFAEQSQSANAIFRSFDVDHSSPEINGHDHSFEFLSITVSDPQKEQELSNSLVPGWIRVVESQVMQKQEFVEQRRAALEKYLRRLAVHPVIRRSEELSLFVQANGKLPLVRNTDVASRMLDGAVQLPKQMFGESVGGMMDANEVDQPAKGGRDLLRIFRELKQSVAIDWGGVMPPVVEEDKELLEKKEKFQDFEQQLSNVSQQAESLVKAQQDIGETTVQMGLAFVKLTKFETEQAVYDSQRTRAADMKNVATASVKASRLYRELNDKLHEYLGVMLAVNNAFSDRSSALLTVHTLLSELSSLKSRIKKFEADSSKDI